MVVAGAQSQALSLWSGAGEVTASFYTELAKGRGRAAALRDAKLSMIEGRGGHPYRWAALVLSGDWRPIEGGHLEPGPKLPAQSLGAPALARGCACRQASDPGGGTGWLCLVLLTLGARLRSER